MAVGDTNRVRIVSIHADFVLHYRFGTDTSIARWRPLARDGADLPPALRSLTPARLGMGPGETADFLYVPTRPGRMMLEVWMEQGQRLEVPVIVSAKSTATRGSR